MKANVLLSTNDKYLKIIVFVNIPYLVLILLLTIIQLVLVLFLRTYLHLPNESKKGFYLKPKLIIRFYYYTFCSFTIYVSIQLFSLCITFVLAGCMYDSKRECGVIVNLSLNKHLLQKRLSFHNIFQIN